MILGFVFVGLVVCIGLAGAIPKSGPFDMRIDRIEGCDDPGTGEIVFGTKVNKKGNNVYTYTNNVTFKYAWDDKLRVDVDIQVLKDGAYRAHFISHNFKTCDAFMKVGLDTMRSLFAAANYELKSCPVPAGVYFVKDWVLKGNVNNMPTFTYGSYRVVMVNIRQGKRVGCTIVYAEVFPKP